MRTNQKLKVGLVVPHIFIHRDILPRVIFSPGNLALDLANGLETENVDVTLFTPVPAATSVQNITADMSYFEQELTLRGDTYIDLLKKHPFTFITLARQVQAEIIAKAFKAANDDKIDIVHIYTNEEDIALPFAGLCNAPVVFTHHDPFNFLVKYKNVFPKYKQLNWLALSEAQKAGMPNDTNWCATIYHGLNSDRFMFESNPKGDYIAYLGRIIEPKGVHLAIEAIKHYNETHSAPIKLKIAGKHYAGHGKDSYWRETIEPELGQYIEYVGYINDDESKQDFLGNARALIVPSTFEEPFGMVTIEALACGTPVIGLNAGATKEIIRDGHTGFIFDKNNPELIQQLAETFERIDTIDRKKCRNDFESRFTLGVMAKAHKDAYERLASPSR